MMKEVMALSLAWRQGEVCPEPGQAERISKIVGLDHRLYPCQAAHAASIDSLYACTVSELAPLQVIGETMAR